MKERSLGGSRWLAKREGRAKPISPTSRMSQVHGPVQDPRRAQPGTPAILSLQHRATAFFQCFAASNEAWLNVGPCSQKKPPLIRKWLSQNLKNWTRQTGSTGHWKIGVLDSPFGPTGHGSASVRGKVLWHRVSWSMTQEVCETSVQMGFWVKLS